MDKEDRDKILKLARKQYELVGCEFPEDDFEMVEYLYDSQHPEEIRCLAIAIEAHNVFNEDDMDIHTFYDWHGM